MFVRPKSGISYEAGLSKLQFTTLLERYKKEFNLYFTQFLSYHK